MQNQVIYFQVENLSIEIHPDSEAAGKAAASAVAKSLKKLSSVRDTIGVIFATGASQLETLHSLTSTPDLPWGKVVGFHLDEYLGLDENHPASFRHYLRKNLTNRVRMKDFFEIDGTYSNSEHICNVYSEALRKVQPQLCLLGVGENGHLAFNEPDEADFEDPRDMKVVSLDVICREQQAAEGWFSSLEEVPKQALTVTVPALMRVPQLIVTAPGKRKAHIIPRALYEPISPRCPATILRHHPAATLYLDHESAAELREVKELRGKP